MNSISNWVWSQTLRKDKKVLFHIWHPSFYSCNDTSCFESYSVEYDRGKRAVFQLRQLEHFRRHLWHRYFITVNHHDIVRKKYDFDLATKNYWFNTLLVNRNLLSGRNMIGNTSPEISYQLGDIFSTLL